MSRIDLTGRGTFAGDGTARAVSASVPVGQVWRLSSCSVHTTSPAITAATVYRGTVSPANRMDGTTRRGNQATTDTPIELRAGEYLTVEWSGGTPGAVADFTATGEAEGR